MQCWMSRPARGRVNLQALSLKGEYKNMKRTLWICMIAGLGLFLAAGGVQAKMLDGFFLESASTLNRGAWNLKSCLEFSSGAEPLTIKATNTVAIKVDSIRLPIELRYGLADNWEVGGDFGFESDDGTAITAGTTTATFLDGSGLQRFRFYGKWNIWRDIGAMAEMSFLGNNKLYYGQDSFDFGLKFMYGPQMGAGILNINLGLLFKGGKADLDGGAFGAGINNQEDYDNVFSYGIGYVYPYTDRFTGIFEIAGASSPFAGGADIGTEDRMSFLLGARYAFTDMFNFDGGFGIGLADGSPNFLLKVGMDVLWGAAEEYTSSTPSQRWTPTERQADERTAGRTDERTSKPTEKPKPQPAQQASKSSTTKTTKPAEEDSYYEPPPRYEPKPAAPAQPVQPAGPTPEEQLQTHIADAQAAFNQGDYTTAAVSYESAIRLKSSDPMLHYNLATTYFQLKKYSDAKTYYKNAVTLKPGDVDSHLYLGYCHYYLQDQTAAVREWQKVTEIDPGNALARENLRSLGIE